MAPRDFEPARKPVPDISVPQDRSGIIPLSRYQPPDWSRRLELTKLRPLSIIPLTEPATDMAFSPDGSRLALVFNLGLKLGYQIAVYDTAPQPDGVAKEILRRNFRETVSKPLFLDNSALLLQFSGYLTVLQVDRPKVKEQVLLLSASGGPTLRPLTAVNLPGRSGVAVLCSSVPDQTSIAILELGRGNLYRSQERINLAGYSGYSEQLVASRDESSAFLVSFDRHNGRAAHSVIEVPLVGQRTGKWNSILPLGHVNYRITRPFSACADFTLLAVPPLDEAPGFLYAGGERSGGGPIVSHYALDSDAGHASAGLRGEIVLPWHNSADQRLSELRIEPGVEARLYMSRREIPKSEIRLELAAPDGPEGLARATEPALLQVRAELTAETLPSMQLSADGKSVAISGLRYSNFQDPQAHSRNAAQAVALFAIGAQQP